nr:hypothetical protein [uncultured Flavobacterium sp.]
MKRIFIGFIFLIFLSCSKKESNQELYTYIISKEDTKITSELKKRKIPPPKTYFYSYNNFIIDKNGDFYFYQSEFVPMNCIQSEQDTIPILFNIKPIQIIKVPKNSIIDFIKTTISSKIEYQQRLIIASQKDTIRNKKFHEIFTFLNDSSTYFLKSFAFRRTTQEEDTVLSYKKLNKYYNSEDIKWDQSRITLPFIKSNLKD